MLLLLSTAFVLGLAFNAAPGPVLAESLRRGLVGGFAPAFAVQLGSLVGDFTWAILGLAGAGLVLTVPLLRLPVEAAGAALLAWMAWDALRASRRDPSPAAKPGPSTRAGAIVAGAALSLSNSQNVTFWAALVAPMAALGVKEPLSAEGATFLGGFALASVVWCFVAASLVAWARRLLTPGLHRALNLLCAAALALFAILALLAAVRSIIEAAM